MPLPTVPRASAPPFRLSSSPLEAFAHPSWQRAEHEALAAVARGQRVLLLGPAGTGKTLLLQSLEQTLRARGADVQVLRRGEPLAAVPGTAVLLIDEAGGFPDEELERICRRPGAVIMAGLPCLQQRTARCAGPVGIATLEKLSPEDVARFVLARLGASGRARDLFTPEAVVALARHSGGLLRLVVILAGAALFFAELRGADRVAAGDVDEAAAMRAAVAEEAESEAPPPEPALLEAPQAGPSWLDPVIPGFRARFSPLTRMITGLAGVTCAGLAVAALAIAAALAVSSAPAIPLQALKEISPALASAAAPVLVEAPQALGSASPPVPLAPPPVQLAAASPPALQPRPAPALQSKPAPALQPKPAPASAPIPAPEPAHALAEAASPPSPLRPLPPPPPDTADRPDIVLAFSGPIMNDTMGQGGRLSLQLRTDGSAGPVGAWFHASNGLIGTGTLRGKILPGGRITLSGRLMMGHNPFDCALQATLDGDRLVGEATFVRATSGARAHSSFTLTRL